MKHPVSLSPLPLSLSFLSLSLCPSLSSLYLCLSLSSPSLCLSLSPLSLCLSLSSPSLTLQLRVTCACMCGWRCTGGRWRCCTPSGSTWTGTRPRQGGGGRHGYAAGPSGGTSETTCTYTVA